MKILLLQDVKKVGKKFEIKEVSDGYARNFLIPQNFARPADQSSLKIKSESETQEKQRLIKISQCLKELEEKPLEFKLKVGSKKEVFGSIKKEDIEKSLLKRMGEDIKIEISEPLRKIGDQEVTTNLGNGLKKKIIIRISER